MFSSSKRSRPRSQTQRRERSEELEESKGEMNEQNSLEDLIAFRKFKKNKQGLSVDLVFQGSQRGEKRSREEVASDLKVGLIGPSSGDKYNDEESRIADEEGDKARKAVRSNNFTQQTNTQDVDKHMMGYIEEQMRLRRKNGKSEEEMQSKNLDPREELYMITSSRKDKTSEEGNVTNSAKMLTAIPEVDLGMDSRLKNIEDTERAKRSAAEANLLATAVRPREEEYTGPARFASSHNKESSEKTATDEIVMERFKKRMRK